MVLVIGGLDPSGAGLQADIETCLSLGCHALPIATGITVQNTQGLHRVIPLEPADVRDQVRTLISDVGEIAACKIGMLPNIEVAIAIADILKIFPCATTIVIDPVISASAGGNLMADQLVLALPDLMFPLSTLIKPNYEEAQRLTGCSNLDAAGRALSKHGAKRKCRYALLTGTDGAAGGDSRHYLYRDGTLFAEYAWPLLEGTYHGTGCTLTTAIAAFSALGETVERAIGLAQSYTWRTVRAAKSIGGAQRIPHRLADLQEPL